MNRYSQSTIDATIADIAWELAHDAPGIAYDAPTLLVDAGIDPTEAHVAALVAAVVSEHLVILEQRSSR